MGGIWQKQKAGDLKLNTVRMQKLGAEKIKLKAVQRRRKRRHVKD